MINPLVATKLVIDTHWKTEVQRVAARDCVADLIAAIDSGRVKGKQFSKEIEEFSPEELGRLSEELLVYYWRKFR